MISMLINNIFFTERKIVWKKQKNCENWGTKWNGYETIVNDMQVEVENGEYEMLSREEILEKAWEALGIPENVKGE